MGEPILDYKLIPARDGKVYKSKDGIKFYKVNINIDNDLKELTCVSMGNPHGVDFMNNMEKLKIEKYGPIIEVDNHFPNKVNVEFIEIIDKNNINMRVWERGAGETLACGTGACASVVASVLNGYTERKVTVKLLGGNLEIEWNKEDNHVYMTGPAKIVFEENMMNLRFKKYNLLNKLYIFN